MATLSDDHVFTVPKKELFNAVDMENWTKSEAYHEFVGFLEALNDGVKGRPRGSNVPGLDFNITDGKIPDTCQPIANLQKMMASISEIVDETPPIEQPQRFGNKAFKTFYEKVCNSSEKLLQTALDPKFHNAAPELAIYLNECFGNSTRIDYGTGHEMSFVMFLYCLFRIGALDSNKSQDKILAVNVLFTEYIDLCRKLQMTYRMEPAGSHGVWSLDDYQFVPFIWGSSQLINDPKLETNHFVEAEVVHKNANHNLFFGCIEYILKVKNGPFHEHSNQLWNISALGSWTKVNQGLIKMYKAEVLAKFPVIQHTMFGSLMSIQPFDPSRFPDSTSLSSKLKFGRLAAPPLAPPQGLPPPKTDNLESGDTVENASLK